MRGIDKTPPAPTGNPQADVDSLYQYLCYLQEQMNYIISLLNKRIGG